MSSSPLDLYPLASPWGPFSPCINCTSLDQILISFKDDWTPIDLSLYFNLKAAATDAQNSAINNFDGHGRGYAAELLPSESTLDYQGIRV